MSKELNRHIHLSKYVLATNRTQLFHAFKSNPPYTTHKYEEPLARLSHWALTARTATKCLRACWNLIPCCFAPIVLKKRSRELRRQLSNRENAPKYLLIDFNS